jgi:AcrR family transcriptional regulator
MSTKMRTESPTRGRPRSFDREQALKSAMELFCVRGYDGATLDELQRVMGNLSPPSFYAAFGSKDELFREAVSLYRATVADRVGEALQATSVRAAIESMLRTAVDVFLSNETAPGCLIVLGALHKTRTSTAAHDHLSALRAQGPEMIRRRLARAVEEGELLRGLSLTDIAGFYTTVLHGLAVRARDGATRAALLPSVAAAMAAWPALTTPIAAPRAGRRASL